jgi:lysyl-tRNA synthetase class I
MKLTLDLMNKTMKEIQQKSEAEYEPFHFVCAKCGKKDSELKYRAHLRLRKTKDGPQFHCLDCLIG